MKLITYKYNDKTQLTEHYRVQEWRCKCGKNHDIVIADTLPTLLENLMKKIGAVRGDILSGYRCPAHEKEIGGSGSTTHQGYACDIKFTDASGKVIDSKKVCLALEDLGHKCGIGYRSGGDSKFTHIDVKPRKWYGDEAKSFTASCCDSFYDYFKEPKPSPEPTKPTKKYVYINAVSGVWCRKCPGFSYAKYKVIAYKSTCELIEKNVATANGYKWDCIKYNGKKMYIPNNWNKYL